MTWRIDFLSLKFFTLIYLDSQLSNKELQIRGRLEDWEVVLTGLK